MTEIKVPTSLRKIIPSKNARDQKHKRDETIKYQQTIDRNTSEFKYHNDEFVIMDISAKEIPQRFRDTFNRMMGELEKIRNELESARAQISYLEEISETHALLPVINRRGLHRELSRPLLHRRCRIHRACRSTGPRQLQRLPLPGEASAPLQGHTDGSTRGHPENLV